MIKSKALKKGDKVAIVSLSAGTLGEAFAKHELEKGKERLAEFGLTPVFMPNSLKGVEYLKNHPEKRADDLKKAFSDKEIKGIFSAIGGNDTYRLAPYLLDDAEFVKNVQEHPKIFSGFSDTTVDHLMLYQLGLTTYYGPNFLNDWAELGPELLPYTKNTLQHYFENPKRTEIKTSPVWYEERTDFSTKAIDKTRISHKETKGFQVLRGSGIVSGTLLGGCLDSLNSLITDRYFADEPKVNQKYHLLPEAKDFQGKILFLETSEEKPSPDLYREMLEHLKQKGILESVSAIITGKPQDEVYYEEYCQILKEVTEDLQTPLMTNLNFGHAYPRTALPYGLKAEVDLDKNSLTIVEPYFA
ncbi:S66 family peptidase [Companilactobacillus halodurans]|uniref:LD-carboxypeptidase n=1 Tax=Companilactobacillus halodurans TaxID=2584183 RepID=A0A5P0ZY71_9LACO|nr:S66 peptidase family protein [Companilactobacillus halodurans]MQS97684.1 LD-carboxypeptidase [Companilactobacillus halodurans]